jgi:AraC family transcriptional regulator, arabinose operon regulatory protein
MIPYVENTWLPGVGTISGGEQRVGMRYTVERAEGRGDWLLLATVGGCGIVGSRGFETRVAVGVVVLFEPDVPQAYRAHTGSWHMLWAHFRARPAWIEWLRWSELVPGLRQATMGPGTVRTRFWEALRRVGKLVRRAGPASADLALNALEEAILWVRDGAAHDGRPSLDPRIRQALDIMGSDLTTPFSVEGIARRCGLSASRFAHLFREQVGVSPQRFSEQCRLNRAAHILRLGGTTVAETAAQSGFENPFYFSLRFKKAFGTSPRGYAASTH